MFLYTQLKSTFYTINFFWLKHHFINICIEFILLSFLYHDRYLSKEMNGLANKWMKLFLYMIYYKSVLHQKSFDFQCTKGI